MCARTIPLLRRTGLALLVATVSGSSLALAAGPAVAAPGAVSVSNGDIGAPCAPLTFCRFDPAGAPGVEVVDTPGAQSGDGYLRLSTPTAADRAAVAMLGDGKLTLGELAADPLAYRTFVETPASSPTTAVPSFTIGILSRKVPYPDGTPQFTGLVWEPVYTGATITPRTWQSWSPSGAASGWWATRDVTSTGTVNRFGFATYTASLQDVVAGVGADAVVTNIGVNQGRGPAGLVAGVDLLTFGGRTYDFENPVTAKAITATAGNAQSAAAGAAFPTRLAATVTGGITRTRPVPNTPWCSR
ncbi:hypothetical protein [Pseudonocardia xishanensis]|uniref:Uncharacterized protein n=1 Tax=Pseudonocardia xishanensis TaxID=630995 RepID=A0ABP8RTB0_9PSEU